ncbi:isochorismatase family protein [Psychrobacter jeotgali]|uniref:isochorismatase family protein n=1 Tax=Psychrobacter jeotgali TaxID=179010 RepID=UPI00191A9D95|nr:isochorismatase family protein [Psychrobacter jeotgali]
MSNFNVEQVKAEPSDKLLTPDNTVFMFIDQQPQMYFGLQSHDANAVMNAIQGLAKTAKIWDIPSILTTLTTDDFTGEIPQQQKRVFEDHTPIDRTGLNAFEDQRVVDAVKKTGRKKIVMSGLWTEICVLLPAITAADQGYDVYVVTDACGGASKEAHDMAIIRMTEAGVTPVTWIQVLCELQRDWAREETYDDVMNIVKEHGGAYGVGVQYYYNPPKNIVNNV